MNDYSALVTGGRRGLGRALALHLVSRGLRVYVLGRAMPEALDPELRAAVEGYLRVDLDAPAPTLDAMLQAVASQQPGVGLLIAAAGVRATGLGLADERATTIRSTIQVNLVAPAMLAHAVLPGMLRRGFGRIVLIGSRAGFRGAPGEAAYGASKAGVISLTESLARELDGRLVTVNAICPETYSDAAGNLTAGGDRIVRRVIEATDTLIDGSAHGRIIPIVSWKHRLVDARREAARAWQRLAPL